MQMMVSFFCECIQRQKRIVHASRSIDARCEAKCDICAGDTVLLWTHMLHKCRKRSVSQTSKSVNSFLHKRSIFSKKENEIGNGANCCECQIFRASFPRFPFKRRNESECQSRGRGWADWRRL